MSNLFPFQKLSISQNYHKLTKIIKFNDKNKKNPPPQEWVDVQFKGYPRFKKIKLDKIYKIDNVPLVKCLEKRQSCRDYSNIGISKTQLSTILKYSAGLKANKDKQTSKRFYPSAGARYPLELYPIIFNVKGLANGIYHYHVHSHSLEFMWKQEDFRQKILFCFNQKWIKNAAVIMVISAVFWRTEVKYGDRSYRHTLLESGLISQNINLISEAVNIGCCSIGGYIDDKIHQLIDLDGQEEAVITVITLGNKNNII